MLQKLVREMQNVRIWHRLRTEWTRALDRICHEEDHGLGARALIIPCDPWGVIGSRGDQAMILACLQHVRAAHPDRVVDVLTDSHDTDAPCRELGLNPVVAWREPLDVWFAAHAGDYAEVYIPGADVTDGVYGWPTACKLLAFYDCFAARGVPVHYLGFSWSETPHRMMKCVLARLAKALPLPVRDPVSLARLSRFTAHRPLVPVADAAFCLQPRETDRVRRHRAWIEAQHAAGCRVIALNVHPMFNDAETKSADWERAVRDTLAAVGARHPDVRWLFLPHDDRPNVSDLVLLKRLFGQFGAGRAYLVDEVMRADEIKSLVGACDGLVAGRMHLSIAALGQGVPVLGLAYQGKFEGLWRHFGLTEETLLAPKAFVADPPFAQTRLAEFLDRFPVLAERIRAELPQVLDKAERNFA